MVSVGANVARATLTVLTGLLVARGLTPTGFGDLAFLLGSFTAIRSLLDMGTAGAFYTFISQRARGPAYYLAYWSWLGLQFLVTLLLVVVILPQSLIDGLWLGNSRGLIVLALAAAFMQQQVWMTIVQIGEAARNTVKVQLMGLAVIVVHLAVIVVLLLGQWLSVVSVLVAVVCEYALASALSLRVLRGVSSDLGAAARFDLREMLREYWKYCKPLLALSLFGFLYEFADRWMLQEFGGADQQGFYQIAAQFAAVSLLATASILNIFWKEISEANDRKNQERVAYLYRKVSRALVMLGAVISCFLIPWSEQIVALLLGPAYGDAWPVLAIMFFYPIHQSMGQISGTILLATRQTRTYMLIGVFGMIASMPVAYFLLAPSGEGALRGMGLGAQGLAMKMVAMNTLLVNLQAWIIARNNGWKYDWEYQVAGIVSALALGYFAKIAVCLSMGGLCTGPDKWAPLAPFVVAGILYAIGVLLFLWMFPSVAGLDRRDLAGAASRAAALINRGRTRL